MKKLLIIGSTLIAFSAVSFMSSNNGNAYAKNTVASMDTIPKKDTSKKKDSITLAYVTNAYVLDTVPKKDSTKKKDSIALNSFASNSFLASLDTTPKKEEKKKDSINLNSYASNSYLASLDTVPSKKDKKKDEKKDSLFLAMR